MKNKYCVVVARTGFIFVEAETEADAMRIANEQPTDAISWSDDWEATDAEEYDGSYSGDYVSEETPASVKYNVFKEPSIEMKLSPGLSARDYCVEELEAYSKSRSAIYGELIGQYDNEDAARVLFEAEKSFCVSEAEPNLILFDELRLERVEYDADFCVEKSTVVETYIDGSCLRGNVSTEER